MLSVSAAVKQVLNTKMCVLASPEDFDFMQISIQQSISLTDESRAHQDSQNKFAENIFHYTLLHP